MNQYFNNSLRTVNAVGTYGNAPRNMLANPGYLNIDLGVITNTQMTEQMNLQFRAEFLNVLSN